MPDRRLPVRPDLDQLKHQAKDLLRALRSGDADAVADLRCYHPDPPDPTLARLADAQLVLARSYQSPSWPRLVQSCRLIDAICLDDLEAVRGPVQKHPTLVHEPARVHQDNWGPPMSYAANLGRNRIIELLHQLGARDLEEHLRRDPTLLRRTFPYREIFPPELECHEEELPRTTLDGASLLHACVEFDELEIAGWLLDRGMPPDAPAAVDREGARVWNRRSDDA